MTIAKMDLIDHIREKNRLGQKIIQRSRGIFLKNMTSDLTEGEDVQIGGFGKFRVNERKARHGRIPVTGENLTLPPIGVVTFKCSGKLKDKMNGNDRTFRVAPYVIYSPPAKTAKKTH